MCIFNGVFFLPKAGFNLVFLTISVISESGNCGGIGKGPKLFKNDFCFQQFIFKRIKSL